jgi:plastocyanin
MSTHRTCGLVSAAALTLTLAVCASPSGQAGAGHQGGHASEAAPASPPGHAHNEPAPPPVAGAPQVALTASAFKYEPAALTLHPGQPVNITLTSTDMLHDFTVEGQDFHLATDTGQTNTGGLHIAQPGTYIAYCTVPGHREAGMQATLTVGQP